MNLLAIDTSSLACTVALSFSGELYERHELQAREHTRLLMPMIREVLNDARAQLPQLDAVVLGNGPGSFIGMRIAASVSQGLAYGSGLKIVPVSSLAAVAAEVFAMSDCNQVAVTQDAHMHEVYLGIFDRGADGRAAAVGVEKLQGLEKIDELAVAGAAGRTAAGAGWQRYPQLYQLNADRFSNESHVLHPRARYLLQLADLDDARLPQDVTPAYLRHKVAEKPTAKINSAGNTVR